MLDIWGKKCREIFVERSKLQEKLREKEMNRGKRNILCLLKFVDCSSKIVQIKFSFVR